MRGRSRLVGLAMGAVAAAAAVSPMYADSSTVGVNVTITISGLGDTAGGLLGTVLGLLQGLLGGLPIGI